MTSDNQRIKQNLNHLMQINDKTGSNLKNLKMNKKMTLKTN